MTYFSFFFPARRQGLALCRGFLLVTMLWFCPAAPAEETASTAKVEKTAEANTAGGRADLPATVEEARSRARWLHETIHGALQVMHRDFFGDDETLNLPSQSLEDVFRELARSWSVEVRWLGVNATKSVDHEPQDQFERDAAKALLTGKPEYEGLERNHYRYVGAIRIQNECLKCHVPHRMSLEDRVAGLAITMPLKRVLEASPAAGEASPPEATPETR